nr:proline-rich extensin-like protein EPR1 [Procambarus clarkii]
MLLPLAKLVLVLGCVGVSWAQSGIYSYLPPDTEFDHSASQPGSDLAHLPTTRRPAPTPRPPAPTPRPPAPTPRPPAPTTRPPTRPPADESPLTFPLPPPSFPVPPVTPERTTTTRPPTRRPTITPVCGPPMICPPIKPPPGPPILPPPRSTTRRPTITPVCGPPMICPPTQPPPRPPILSPPRPPTRPPTITPVCGPPMICPPTQPPPGPPRQPSPPPTTPSVTRPPVRVTTMPPHDHHEPHDHDHHHHHHHSSDPLEWLRESVPGEPGVDYPILGWPIVDTDFSCAGRPDGYYADPETRCQAFHICLFDQDTKMLCPNGTIFNQEYFTCSWWKMVDCSTAQSFYELNNEIGVVPVDSPYQVRSPRGTASFTAPNVPLSPFSFMLFPSRLARQIQSFQLR